MCVAELIKFNLEIAQEFSSSVYELNNKKKLIKSTKKYF